MRIGILGTGSISGWWMESVRESPRVRVTAVGSRNAARARDFADRFALPRWHDSYQALIDDADVDAVYVALPNHLHAPWSIAAARAGKHVLCEKPLAGTLAGAREMFEVARAQGVVLLEAFAYRFTAQSRCIAQLIAEGAIGTPLIFRANMSYIRNDGSAEDRRLGGGALMDSGCYCVSLSRLVMGRAPRRVNALAALDNKGRDESLVATLDFGAGAIGQISCSYVAPAAPQLQIIGTDGVIETSIENASWLGRPLSVRVKRGRSYEAEFESVDVEGTDGYRMEAEALRALSCGEAIDWPGMPAAESLDVAACIEALDRSARSESWVELESIASEGSKKEAP